MSRLILQAVSGESKFTDVIFHLELFMSVSYADTGMPVSGLTAKHVRLCSPQGKLFDAHIAACNETTWDRGGENAGCYTVSVSITKDGGKQMLEWLEGEYYPFGIQVRFTDSQSQTHFGQTVTRIQSLGK